MPVSIAPFSNEDAARKSIYMANVTRKWLN